MKTLFGIFFSVNEYFWEIGGIEKQSITRSTIIFYSKPIQYKKYRSRKSLQEKKKSKNGNKSETYPKRQNIYLTFTYIFLLFDGF